MLKLDTPAYCRNDFGLGIIVGEPTGISWKKWLSDQTAISGASGWSFTKNSHVYIYTDWLHHNWSFLKNAFELEKGELPLFYGIGGRIRIENDSRIGFRFIMGVSYIFENAPFDIYIEAAPIMDVAPETELDSSAAIGIRYWF
ncbi:MAG TPA: hypothetical protein VMZ04_02850 [Anaerolineae bacterium]|nr:hypothetical protein [Anaerolineae bacterium]